MLYLCRNGANRVELEEGWTFPHFKKVVGLVEEFREKGGSGPGGDKRSSKEAVAKDLGLAARKKGLEVVWVDSGGLGLSRGESGSCWVVLRRRLSR